MRAQELLHQSRFWSLTKKSARKLSLCEGTGVDVAIIRLRREAKADEPGLEAERREGPCFKTCLRHNYKLKQTACEDPQACLTDQ